MFSTSLLLAMLSSGSPIAPQHPLDASVPGWHGRYAIADPKAKALVRAMNRAYATCRTYRDRGTMTDESERIVFETRFRRPDRILFKYRGTSDAQDLVYWTVGKRGKVVEEGYGGKTVEGLSIPTNGWYGPGRLEANRSLGLTVAGFTGISRGTATTVPNMLFPWEVRALSFPDMADLRLVGSAKERGVLCDVLESKKHLTKAWIERKTRLLRRLEERFDPSDPMSVTLYEPRIDVPVSDAELTFAPPSP